MLYLKQELLICFFKIFIIDNSDKELSQARPFYRYASLLYISVGYITIQI